MRKFVLFMAVLFVALVAGAAFAIWFDYDPKGMSPAFYTEKMQHAIRIFTIPLPTIVILGVIFTGISAFLDRARRPDFYLLLAATVCIIAVALITRFGNIRSIMKFSNGASALLHRIGQIWRRSGGTSKP